MSQIVTNMSFAVVLLWMAGCKKDKEVACVDVAAAVKKWAEVSLDGDSASFASQTILETCSAEKWSQARKKCVIGALGEAEPLEGMIECKTGSKAVAKEHVAEYVAKSKSAEARSLLWKMSDSAAAYYLDPPITGGEKSLTPSLAARHFPQSVGPTPPLGACCKNGGQCQPSDGDWSTASWEALKFAMMDPHYYSYEFKSTEAGYEAIAHGDLDCDGVYSTFSITGKWVDGEVDTSEIFETNALE